MAAQQVVIENLVINSPSDEPKRHFRFADEGITNEIVANHDPNPQTRIPKVRRNGDWQTSPEFTSFLGNR